MRGSLYYNGKTMSGIHLSVDPQTRDVHFCRYDAKEDVFDDVLFLREFQLFVPDHQCLEFSGFHPLEEDRFEFLTVEFFPSRADFIHDSWTWKMSGRSAVKGGLIGG